MRQYTSFLKENKIPIFVILFINLLSLFLVFWMSKIDDQIANKYSLLQNRQSTALNIQGVRDNITNAINIDTPTSIRNLSIMIYDDFVEDSNNKEVNYKYKNGQLDLVTYWNQVLKFYEDKYDRFASDILTIGAEIEKLRDKLNLLSLINLVLNIFFLPINIFLTIFLSKKIEKII